MIQAKNDRPWNVKYCPECGAEYTHDAVICADCEVPLVLEPPQDRERDRPDAREPLDLVTVYQTGDLGQQAFAKSLLEEAEIPFLARNELLQDLFGFGRAVPVNPISGPVIFQVAAENLEAARETLARLIEDEEN
jgi:hypothetical protein